MTPPNRVGAASRLYGRLNEVPQAQRYLTLFDRDVEVQVGAESICLHVQDGRIDVRSGAALQPERSVLVADAEAWDAVVAGRMGFAAAGGGIGGRLRCVAGQGSWDDLSWVGILTRLAQENR